MNALNLPTKGSAKDTVPRVAAAGVRQSSDDIGRSNNITEHKILSRQNSPKKASQNTMANSTSGAFGKPTVSDVSASEILSSYPQSKLMQWKLEDSENIYHSSKRKPLGKPFMRGTEIPEGLGDTTSFGIQVHAEKLNKYPVVKDVLYNDVSNGFETGLRETKSTLPGEQISRNYNWGDIDPTDFRFGLAPQGTHVNGVAQALNPGKFNHLEQGARIVSKTYDDFKLSDAEELSRPKNLGQGHGRLRADHVFGKPSRSGELEPSAKEVIHFGYVESDQQPDSDLGKCQKSGLRNVSESVRVFGAPSIRIDLPRKLSAFKSVADPRNYGNELDAKSLISPSISATSGIFEEDFLSFFSRSEMKKLLSDSDVYIPDALFDDVFDICLSTSAHPKDERVSVSSFQNALLQKL